MLTTLFALGYVAYATAHGTHDNQKTLSGPHQALWYNTLPGDGGTQADSVFSGITTFGRLPYQPCLGHDDIDYDLAFIGWSIGCSHIEPYTD